MPAMYAECIDQQKSDIDVFLNITLLLKSLFNIIYRI